MGFNYSTCQDVVPLLLTPLFQTLFVGFEQGYKVRYSRLPITVDNGDYVADKVPQALSCCRQTRRQIYQLLAAKTRFILMCKGYGRYRGARHLEPDHLIVHIARNHSVLPE